MYDTLWPILHQYADIMTGETIGTQLGCYSIAIASLAIANRKIRPFTRFQKPSDIPKNFIKNRIELTGIVENINPNGGLLMVQHVPLVPLSRRKVENLPIKLSGINVSGHGINWLQTIVAGNKIKFIPIKQDKHYVHCEVTMQQLSHENKPQTLNVAESLVSVGFGKILLEEVPKSDVKRVAYLNRLLYAQKNAQKKQLGYKYYVIPLQMALINFIVNLFRNIKSKVQRLGVSPEYGIKERTKAAVN